MTSQAWNVFIRRKNRVILAKFLHRTSSVFCSFPLIYYEEQSRTICVTIFCLNSVKYELLLGTDTFMWLLSEWCSSGRPANLIITLDTNIYVWHLLAADSCVGGDGSQKEMTRILDISVLCWGLPLGHEGGTPRRATATPRPVAWSDSSHETLVLL
jgi:hypothetical protein